MCAIWAEAKAERQSRPGSGQGVDRICSEYGRHRQAFGQVCAIYAEVDPARVGVNFAPRWAPGSGLGEWGATGGGGGGVVTWLVLGSVRQHCSFRGERFIALRSL